MLKRKPANEIYQQFPYYGGVHKPKQKIFGLVSDRENLMKRDYKMVLKRRFERIYHMMECKSYLKKRRCF